MKRERRLYLNGAGAYRGLDDDIAYLQLVESVEASRRGAAGLLADRDGQEVLRARPIRRLSKEPEHA